MDTNSNAAASAAGSVSDDAFNIQKELQKLEQFGVAFAEMEATGIGEADLNLNFPSFDEKLSGDVQVIRKIAYTLEVDEKGLRLHTKVAS